MNHIAWLDPATLGFPPLSKALVDPDGLLAAGGDLSPERLVLAYRSGIFPWYEEGQPILWWSPDPRSVLFPENIYISRTLRKKLKSDRFEVRIDSAFSDVVDKCSGPRDYSAGTWITEEMKEAYLHLHNLGLAHSIETWEGGSLVGGLYGVGVGRLFFGESMFHHTTDASKVALAHLCRVMRNEGCPLIDCQVENNHLVSMGATRMRRTEFEAYLHQYCGDESDQIRWDLMPTNLGPW